MTQTKHEGDDECTSPETECLAFACFEQPRIDTGEPSGEREKQIAAVEVFLKKADDQEAEGGCQGIEHTSGLKRGPHAASLGRNRGGSFCVFQQLIQLSTIKLFTR